LGLSCGLCGTGFCISVDVLKEIGWGATCLTEDLEFTMKLALNNYKVAWAHNAVVYDEKPITLKQSWNQRKGGCRVMPTVQADIWARCLKKPSGKEI